ncbi:MAG TPA: winged helix DNA-binding protein [Methanocellales archaeon]|nr:winged helix DNA-binding protein [Methanocellales archaeon]
MIFFYHVNEDKDMTLKETVKESIENMFLREKPASILLAIAKQNKPYASVISKEVDTTYAHTTSVLSEMEHYGLISSNQDGRVKYIELTDLGKNIAEALSVLISAFGDVQIIPEAEGNTELQEKITSLRLRVERIYKEELACRKSLSIKESTKVSRRLGPYCREIRKMDKTPIRAESSRKEFDELKKRIEELMQLKEKLKSPSIIG